MRKVIIIFMVTISCIATTSCIKDWKCDCSDGTNRITVTTYPNTRLTEAKSKCDRVQVDARKLNPNLTCTIK